MSKKSNSLLLGVVVVTALLMPSLLGPYGHYILAMVAIYALVCMGMNIVLGMGGQISIGHAAFWAIGAYTSAVLVAKGVSMLLAVVIGGIFAALAGLLVALPALRVQGHYLAIATLGFALVIQQILYEWDSVTGGRQGMLALRPELLGIDLSSDGLYYYVVLVFVVLGAWLMNNFRKSMDGLGLSAMRMSSTAAQVVGIPRAKGLFVAFGFSAFLTGVSGALYAHLIGQLSTDSFTLTVSLSFLTAAVVGGTNGVIGALLGGLFLALAPELLRNLKDAQNIVYGAILIVFMRFLPGGLETLPQLLMRRWNARNVAQADPEEDERSHGGMASVREEEAA